MKYIWYQIINWYLIQQAKNMAYSSQSMTKWAIAIHIIWISASLQQVRGSDIDLRDQLTNRRQLSHLKPDPCFTSDCTSNYICEVPYGSGSSFQYSPVTILTNSQAICGADRYSCSLKAYDCSSSPPASNQYYSYSTGSNFAVDGSIVIDTTHGVHTAPVSLNLCTSCVYTVPYFCGDWTGSNGQCPWVRTLNYPFKLKICSPTVDMQTAGPANNYLFEKSSYTLDLTYAYDNSIYHQLSAIILSNLAPIDATFCPIYSIKIWSFDGSTFSDISSASPDFMVQSLTTIRFKPIQTGSTDYYIAGYTFKGVTMEVPQDFFKMRIRVVNCNNLYAATNEVNTVYIYRFLDSNPFQFTWSDYQPIEPFCIQTTGIQIWQQPSQVTYPTASACSESPCRTVDIDSSQISNFQFKLRYQLAANPGNGYSTSQTYHETDFIDFFVQDFVVVPYILPPSNMEGITKRYKIFLDADGTGTIDTHLNNVYRFDAFSCIATLGCPNPAGQVVTFYKVSGSNTGITPSTVADVVAIGSKLTITINTATRGLQQFFVAAAIAKHPDSDPCGYDDQECACPSGNTVYYGAQVSAQNRILDTTLGYLHKNSDPGGITDCAQSFFGGDPVPGISKYCWCGWFGIKQFGQAEGSYTQVTIDVICGSETPSVAFASPVIGAIAPYVLPLATMTQTQGATQTFLLSSIYTFSSDKSQCPISQIDFYADDELSEVGSPYSRTLSSRQISLLKANNPSRAAIQYRIDQSYKISFYARGSTDGRVYNNGAFVKITVIVCGGEQLTLAPDAQDSFKILYETTKPFVVITRDDYDPWFKFSEGPADISCRSREYSILNADCRTSLDSTYSQLITLEGNNVTNYTITLQTSNPTERIKFCLLETTVGLVSVGRVIEFQVCGRIPVESKPSQASFENPNNATFCEIYFQKLNKVPEIFEQESKTTIFFDLTNNLTNAEYDEETFLYNYKSKKANDTDGPNEIDGPSGIEWDCTRVPKEAFQFFKYQIIDDHFVMTVDYTIMTKTKNNSNDVWIYEIECQVLDIWTLLYEKDTKNYIFSLQISGQVPSEEIIDLVIDPRYEKQTTTGLIFLNVGSNLTKTDLLKELSIGYQPFNLSFINSTLPIFDNEFFWPTISHSYDIFWQIAGMHEFEWQFERYYDEILVIKFTYQNPQFISYKILGTDFMTMQFLTKSKDPKKVCFGDLFNFNERQFDESDRQQLFRDEIKEFTFDLVSQKSHQNLNLEALIAIVTVVTTVGSAGLAGQIGLNFLMAFGFSKMNIFIISLQILIYSSFLTDLLFPDDVDYILSMFTFIAQLDIISEDISNFCYESVLGLEFSDEDQAHQSLQKLNFETKNFIFGSGSMLILIIFYLLIAFINELLIGFLCVRRCRCRRISNQDLQLVVMKQPSQASNQKLNFEYLCKYLKLQTLKIYLSLNKQTFFNNTFELLFAGQQDIIISILMALSSPYFLKQAESGELVGDILAIAMTIIMTCKFVVTYLVIRHIQYSDKLENLQGFQEIQQTQQTVTEMVIDKIEKEQEDQKKEINEKSCQDKDDKSLTTLDLRENQNKTSKKNKTSMEIKTSKVKQGSQKKNKKRDIDEWSQKATKDFYHEGGEPLCSLDDLKEWKDEDLPVKKKRRHFRQEKLVYPVRVPRINFDFIFDDEVTRTLKRDIKELERINKRIVKENKIYDKLQEAEVQSDDEHIVEQSRNEGLLIKLSGDADQLRAGIKAAIREHDKKYNVQIDEKIAKINAKIKAKNLKKKQIRKKKLLDEAEKMRIEMKKLREERNRFQEERRKWQLERYEDEKVESDKSSVLKVKMRIIDSKAAVPKTLIEAKTSETVAEIVKEQIDRINEEVEEETLEEMAEDPLRMRFEIITEDIEVKKGIWPLLYKPIWTLRILLVLFVGFHNIFKQDQSHIEPIFQVYLFIFSNFFYLLYLIKYRPYTSRQLFLLDLFNSSNVYSCSVYHLYFIKSPHDGGAQGPFLFPHQKDALCLFLLLTIIFMSIVNVCLMIQDQVMLICNKIQQLNYYRLLKEALLERYLQMRALKVPFTDNDHQKDQEIDQDLRKKKKEQLKEKAKADRNKTVIKKPRKEAKSEFDNYCSKCLINFNERDNYVSHMKAIHGINLKQKLSSSTSKPQKPSHKLPKSRQTRTQTSLLPIVLEVDEPFSDRKVISKMR